MYRLAIVLVLALGTTSYADPGNQIPFKRSVDVKLGQSVIVNGYRGDCGKRPKNVDPNRTRDTRLGVLSNGKWGVVQSKTCGGWTPAVEVVFTARKKGKETIRVAGENIKITVR